jgi:hypothetical protein
MRRSSLVSIMLCLVALPAVAHETSVHVRDDGAVIGRLLIDAEADQIRAAIPGMQDANGSSNVLEAKVVPNGLCRNIFRKTKGLWRPLEMNTQFCPTTSGWREFLVESSDFNAYETEWVLRPQPGGGTQVQLRVVSDVNLTLPAGMVRDSTVQSVRETLATLLERVFRPRKSD